MIKGENCKYHYFYKITNTVNGKFYYGVHNTDNLSDGYMGSGVRLHRAFKKYGKENFKKEILLTFNTAADAFKYEKNFISESLVKDDNCYNCEFGGVGAYADGYAVMMDKNGNVVMVDIDDPAYKNGELVGVAKGTMVVKDSVGNMLRVSVDDKRLKTGELVSIFKNKTLVKDKDGNVFSVYITDERYINGELKPIWCGKKHTENTKQKISETSKNKGLQKGSANSQFGTMWVNNGSTNKKIDKNEFDHYARSGWKKGRLISKEQLKNMHDSIKVPGGKDTVWVSNDEEKKSTYVKREKLDEYLSIGWVIGRKYYKNK